MDMLIYLLPALMFLIMVACVGWCYTDGMWSNAIRLVNTVTAALLATNFFEPVARWLDATVSSSHAYTFLWDFLALWGLFFLATLVLRALTDSISRVKVKFLKLADNIGSGILSAWIGWVMICFTMASFHTAPLSRTFLFDGFQPRTQNDRGPGPRPPVAGIHAASLAGSFSRTAADDDVRNRTDEANDSDAKQSCVSSIETAVLSQVCHPAQAAGSPH